MHVDASCIVLDVVLIQAGEGDIDHLIAFASRKLSKAKKNYSTTEHEGLAMGTTEISTLFVVHEFQNLYNSICSQVPSQEACVEGEDLQVVIVVSGV